jgi:formate dehydrogenase (coenzyme F420) beta subunit
MDRVIKVENNNVTAAMRYFLAQLLETELIDALYVALESDDGMALPALVTDSARLKAANPFAPLMPINNARAVSALTTDHGESRIGVVLRPCEIRALLELTKLKQASLAVVILIGIDCLGTCELAEMRRIFAGNGDHTADLLPELFSAAQEGREPQFLQVSLRSACQVCVTAVPEHADIHIHLFGTDTSKGLPVTMPDQIAARLQIPACDEGESWSPETGKIVAEKFGANRKQKRSQELASIRKQMNADGGIASLFSACIRCHNCMTACPICYCKTCLFRTASFDHEPSFYMAAAKRKGALRMMSDTLLFHLTRLAHMSTSCVSCGMCTSACPAEIPVGAIFSAVAEQTQSAFDYIPGRDLNEPLPLVTFQPEEWITIGEEK